MANPNIVNVTSIYGSTAYQFPAVATANQVAWTYAGVPPATSGSTSLSGLTPASGSVNRVTSIVVSNITASAANCTVTVHDATAGSGNAYNIAYQVSVPPNASLIVMDKTTSVYITEYQSISVTSGTASALKYVATLETITS
jgi:hypothetical protein